MLSWMCAADPSRFRATLSLGKTYFTKSGQNFCLKTDCGISDMYRVTAENSRLSFTLPAEPIALCINVSTILDFSPPGGSDDGERPGRDSAVL